MRIIFFGLGYGKLCLKITQYLDQSKQTRNKIFRPTEAGIRDGGPAKAKYLLNTRQTRRKGDLPSPDHSFKPACVMYNRWKGE
jgi:hypothetical protein